MPRILYDVQVADMSSEKNHWKSEAASNPIADSHVHNHLACPRMLNEIFGQIRNGDLGW